MAEHVPADAAQPRPLAGAPERPLALFLPEVAAALRREDEPSSEARRQLAQCAAQLVGDLAASDNRFLIILTLFVPALGWVLFNMAVSAFRFEFGI